MKPKLAAVLSRAGIAATFVAYLAMLCSVVPFHEPWSDEAESWLVARDFGVFPMLFKVLRYEGHPGLWYMVLWLPAHMHMAYHYITWYSASLAAIGVLIFLLLAPFPLYLRMVLPFTFYLAYQYSVIARGYVLFPLLVFLIAYVYRALPERRVLLAVLLGLLANLSFHGTLVAIGFAIAFWLTQRKADTVIQSPENRRNLLQAGVVFFCFLLFAAACLWPASDTLAPPTKALWLYHHLAIPVHDVIPPGGAVGAQGTPADLPGASAAAAMPLTQPSHLHRLVRVLQFSFASSKTLAILYQLVFIAYLVRRKQAVLLIPYALLTAFLSGVYNAPWHLGMMFVLHLALLWIAWDARVSWRQLTLQNGVAVSLGILCVLQFAWTATAVKNDRANIYSAGKGLADYIKSYPAGVSVAGYGSWVEVLPYFEHNIYIHNAPYRGAFKPDPGQLTYEQAFALKPTLVVLAQEDTLLPRFLAEGYRLQYTECGHAYFPNYPAHADCMVILGYSSDPSPAAPLSPTTR